MLLDDIVSGQLNTKSKVVVLLLMKDDKDVDDDILLASVR